MTVATRSGCVDARLAAYYFSRHPWLTFRCVPAFLPDHDEQAASRGSSLCALGWLPGRGVSRWFPVRCAVARRGSVRSPFIQSWQRRECFILVTAKVVWRQVEGWESQQVCPRAFIAIRDAPANEMMTHLPKRSRAPTGMDVFSLVHNSKHSKTVGASGTRERPTAQLPMNERLVLTNFVATELAIEKKCTSRFYWIIQFQVCHIW